MDWKEEIWFIAVKDEGKSHKKEKKKKKNKKNETENAVEAIDREGDVTVRGEDDMVESKSDAKKRMKKEDANNDRSEEKKKKKTGETDIIEDVMDKGGQTTGKTEEGCYGARPLRGAIMRLLEDNMAEKMLSGEIKEGDSVIVDVDSDVNVTVLNGSSGAPEPLPPAIPV